MVVRWLYLLYAAKTDVFTAKFSQHSGVQNVTRLFGRFREQLTDYQCNVNPLLTPKYRLKKFSQIKENNST